MAVKEIFWLDGFFKTNLSISAMVGTFLLGTIFLTLFVANLVLRRVFTMKFRNVLIVSFFLDKLQIATNAFQSFAEMNESDMPI